jgi:hypothetical protein
MQNAGNDTHEMAFPMFVRTTGASSMSFFCRIEVEVHRKKRAGCGKKLTAGCMKS